MEGTVYDKLKKLKHLLQKEIGKVEDSEWFKTGGKLECWHYPSKRWNNMKLSKYEAMVYEFYVKNKYNPTTVYKWMLACNTNKDLQNKIKNKKISFRKALTKAKPYKELTETEVEFMYQVKLCIRKYVIR